MKNRLVAAYWFLYAFFSCNIQFGWRWRPARSIRFHGQQYELRRILGKIVRQA